MFKRIIFGLLLIAASAGVIGLDWFMEQRGIPKISGTGEILKGVILTGVILLLILICYRELSRIIVAVGHPRLGVVGLICTLAVVAMPFYQQVIRARYSEKNSTSLMILLLTMIVLIVFLEHIIRFRTQNVVERLSTTMLAVSYLGICGAMMLTIRMDFGVVAFTTFLLAVKTADIGAYFTGSFVGKHKLIVWLSPDKSWEGLFGGMVFSIISTVLFTIIVRSFGRLRVEMPLRSVVIYSAVVALFGQVADLCESALKRDANVKDAGNAIPSFGGVLDILDSPLLAAPIGYALLMVLW